MAVPGKANLSREPLSAYTVTMKITKLGHCCILVEEKGVRLLTDPGTFTVEEHTSLTGLDAILFTHEHWDHYHLESLKTLIKGNPKARVICNEGVGVLLEKASIPHEKISNGQSVDVKGILIEGFGTTHAPLHSSLPQMQNTGFFINNLFWYPGDAFTNPGKPVEIMALPVAGPWMKLAEAIDYALEVKPKRCFPVHDGFVLPMFISAGPLHTIPATVLEPRGIQFFAVELDKEYEF
jgi:L-ascorbate metabolism protein UlaG (beta-lactamase superfamily)